MYDRDHVKEQAALQVPPGALVISSITNEMDSFSHTTVSEDATVDQQPAARATFEGAQHVYHELYSFVVGSRVVELFPVHSWW